MRTEIKEYVDEKTNSIQVIRMFQDLNDLLRESSEESFSTIQDRRIAVHETLKELMRTYW